MRDTFFEIVFGVSPLIHSESPPNVCNAYTSMHYTEACIWLSCDQYCKYSLHMAVMCFMRIGIGTSVLITRLKEQIVNVLRRKRKMRFTKKKNRNKIFTDGWNDRFKNVCYTLNYARLRFVLNDIETEYKLV